MGGGAGEAEGIPSAPHLLQGDAGVGLVHLHRELGAHTLHLGGGRAGVTPEQGGTQQCGPLPGTRLTVRSCRMDFICSQAKA